MDRSQKIWLAGAGGMVGKAILRELKAQGYEHVEATHRQDVNCLDSESVNKFFRSYQPDILIMAAARVGGIHANDTYPASFLYENLQMQNNLIHGAHEAGVNRLLFLGSSCIYPRLAPQPMPEEALLTGPLEPTNEAYAVAKIAGIKMCQAYRRQYGRDYISLMPCNLYGPGDNYHLENAHVLPTFIRRFHEAKEEGKEVVEIWGSGMPKREFLHVNDLARAALFLLKGYHGELPVNVGSSDELTIHGLAKLVAEIVGYEGKIALDPARPDGTPRKKTDCRRILQMGWQPEITLEEGIQLAYSDFLENLACLREF